MDVIEVLKATSDAYTDVKAKAEARNEAAVAHEIAHQAYVEASNTLAGLQEQLRGMIGDIMPAANPRVRIG